MHIRRSEPSYFLADDKVPQGFRYPEAYRTLVASGPFCIGATNEDWCFIDHRDVDVFLNYARQISPAHPLVPFMRRNGEDGVACFDGLSTDGNPRIYQFNYCNNIGWGGGKLTFEEWLALIPPADEEDQE